MAPPKMRLIGSKDYSRTPGLRTTGKEPWTPTAWDKAVQDNPIIKAVLDHDQKVRDRREESMVLYGKSHVRNTISEMVEQLTGPTSNESSATLIANFDRQKNWIFNSGASTMRSKSGLHEYTKWFEEAWSEQRVGMIGQRQRMMTKESLAAYDLAMEKIKSSNAPLEKRKEMWLEWEGFAYQNLNPEGIAAYRSFGEELGGENWMWIKVGRDYGGDWTGLFNAAHETLKDPNSEKSKAFWEGVPLRKRLSLYNEMQTMANNHGRTMQNRQSQSDQDWLSQTQLTINNMRENNDQVGLAKLYKELNDESKNLGVSITTRLAAILHAGGEITAEQQEILNELEVPTESVIWRMIYDLPGEYGVRAGYEDRHISKFLENAIAAGYIKSPDRINKLRTAISELNDYRKGNISGATRLIDETITLLQGAAKDGVVKLADDLGGAARDMSVTQLATLRAGIKQDLIDWVKLTGESDEAKILDKTKALLKDANLTEAFSASWGILRPTGPGGALEVREMALTNAASYLYAQSHGGTMLSQKNIGRRINFNKLPKAEQKIWKEHALQNFLKIDKYFQMNGVTQDQWDGDLGDVAVVMLPKDDGELYPAVIPRSMLEHKNLGEGLQGRIIKGAAEEAGLLMRQHVQKQMLLMPEVANRTIQSSLATALSDNPDPNPTFQAIHPYNTLTLTDDLLLRESPQSGIDNQIVFNDNPVFALGSNQTPISVVGIQGRWALVKVGIPSSGGPGEVTSVKGYIDLGALKRGAHSGWSISQEITRPIPGTSWNYGNNENGWSLLRGSEYDPEQTVFQHLNEGTGKFSVANIGARIDFKQHQEELRAAQARLDNINARIIEGQVSKTLLQQAGMNIGNAASRFGFR